MVAQKTALPLSASHRLAAASPRDLYAPAKINSPVYARRSVSSIPAHASPYLRAPSRFVMSRTTRSMAGVTNRRNADSMSRAWAAACAVGPPGEEEEGEEDEEDEEDE
ncbi:hypothetical protein CesoFtcFv8_016413 [Champsocephalus esox]|uniref:Uncharacterized protein n=1 Tax=Champsocephalus esox TaxID=159716 RepID=A0AAN8BN83_9TELE|nr:hypothetical protein CesoFtcFv8_016413 [Champsocephalus esox]